jgi:5-methylcytosine-specific restriction endonuclease McrA
MLARLTTWLGDRIAGRPHAQRSPRWPRLRAVFLAACPCCAACGTRQGLEVHHVRPVHRFPHLELAWDNLLTLCGRCHLFVGHLGSWDSWNPEVVGDAAHWRLKISQRPT